MATSPELRTRLARLAANARWHPDQPDDAEHAELVTERLAEHIRRVIATAPPLTPAQLDQLRAQLPAPAGSDGT